MKDCGDDDDDRCDSITTRVREREREKTYMWLKVRRSGEGGPKWKGKKEL